MNTVPTKNPEQLFNQILTDLVRKRKQIYAKDIVTMMKSFGVSPSLSKIQSELLVAFRDGRMPNYSYVVKQVNNVDHFLFYPKGSWIRTIKGIFGW